MGFLFYFILCQKARKSHSQERVRATAGGVILDSPRTSVSCTVHYQLDQKKLKIHEHNPKQPT
jgi:hypothetical protein